MTTTMKCTAKNRETCRYHGSLQHAIIDLTAAETAHQKAEQSWKKAGEPDRTHLQTRKYRTTKRALQKAQTVYDAEPAPFKELKESLQKAKEALDVDTAKALDARLQNATALRTERKKESDRIRAEKKKVDAAKTAFQRWEDSQEAADLEARSPEQKTFDTAFAKALINSPQFSGWDTPSLEAVTHMRECGVRAISNIWEDIEVETQQGYYGDETHVEKTVNCDASCNCGQVFKQPLRNYGTLADIILPSLTAEKRYDEKGKRY